MNLSTSTLATRKAGTEILQEFVLRMDEADLNRDENLARIEIATLALIFITTVLGNATFFLALWMRKRYSGTKKLSRMYFFILHLSVADLIVAFFSVLPQLAWEITYRFQGGFLLCKVVKFGQTLGPYLSSYILMATAIDRHQAICYPLTYYSWTSRCSKVMMYVAWLASILCCVPQVIIFSYQEVAPGINDCWATFDQEWGAQAYVIWYSISIFIVPLFVLVYTYTCICCEIWRCSDSVLRPQSSFKNGTERHKVPFISRAKINTVKQTVAVIVMYIVCSTPFIFAQLWATIDPSSSFLEGSTFTILTLLYSLNSCVNPWIYLFFNRELPRILIKRLFVANTQYTATSDGGHTVSNSSGDHMTSLKLMRNSPARDERRWMVTAT
ncbi:oxytocin receptor-like [Anthonomus grandis grandis]|uniref:oxytocin receptor-like n=1 Tax=Anthonomus grandis grandis TaxID=2921223 RepID=UPI002166565B|nr:oxytocin receptor-like [Anthonomus grandis grandis]XP_050308228.1 oxytocin receptor-like [Anthonomus grandis grandis]XP_050308229.1 oxytocin receptor-like [Anthonomus grandis grandis]